MDQFVMYYLVMVNALGFTIMGIDKKRAIRNQWRIPEKTLFLISVIGGSLGAWAGMYTFRHKTKHWYFVVGIPAILIAQIAIVYFFIPLHR